MKKLLIAFALATILPAGARAVTLHVSAAASLTDVLQEMAPIYEKQTGDKLLFNLGASSILARQVQEGAPTDVFISADEAKMDQLQRQHLIVNASRRSILSNTLVIVAPIDSHLKIASPADLAGRSVKTIALAEPGAVPAGIYAKEYLRKLGLWPKVVGKVIPMENVRSALAAVESGNADAGIVYSTDALISKGVRVAYEVPVSEGPNISYPAAVIADSKDKAAAQRFLDFLQSPRAAELFRKYRFIVSAPSPASDRGSR
ncbi:MAG TPA: molybdate ABC transporter substrate-binding protein [Thermoanaerobaculia bacterium]|jgi:molybdate transport system substrate-binding protein|nr:molybdate ABC transporter substrate-binding protein [Thermoanaerobaculia bacterium]